jgi:hypothetical protein
MWVKLRCLLLCTPHKLLGLSVQCHCHHGLRSLPVLTRSRQVAGCASQSPPPSSGWWQCGLTTCTAQHSTAQHATAQHRMLGHNVIKETACWHHADPSEGVECIYATHMQERPCIRSLQLRNIHPSLACTQPHNAAASNARPAQDVE